MNYEIVRHEYPEDRIVTVDTCQYGWPEPCVSHPVFSVGVEYSPEHLAMEPQESEPGTMKD